MSDHTNFSDGKAIQTVDWKEESHIVRVAIEHEIQRQQQQSTKTLITLDDAILDELMDFFAAELQPSRKVIVSNIINKHSHLRHTLLDIQVATRLNFLVNQHILHRVDSKYYAPGYKYFH